MSPSLTRRYRLVRTALIVCGAIAAMLAFFFAFVLAPVVGIGLFYLGYVVAERRVELASRVRGAARTRRRRLAHDAVARRAELAAQDELR